MWSEYFQTTVESVQTPGIVKYCKRSWTDWHHQVLKLLQYFPQELELC